MSRSIRWNGEDTRRLKRAADLKRRARVYKAAGRSRAQVFTFREPTLVAADGRKWTQHSAVHLNADGTADVVAQVTSEGETRTNVERARIATREITHGGRVTGRTYQGLTGPYQQPIIGAWERTITRAAQRAATDVAWRAVRFGGGL